VTPLVLDTSGIYALLDTQDPAHRAAIAATERYQDLIVPAFVLVEVDYWLRKGGGGAAAFALFIADVRAGAYRLEMPVEDDLSRAAELGETYADLDLGVVDASVIALCERLGLEIVLTLDRRDFSVVRPRHCAALQILP
jgi:predicted nucleic acid-binding protein